MISNIIKSFLPILLLTTPLAGDWAKSLIQLQEMLNSDFSIEQFKEANAEDLHIVYTQGREIIIVGDIHRGEPRFTSIKQTLSHPAMNNRLVLLVEGTERNPIDEEFNRLTSLFYQQNGQIYGIEDPFPYLLSYGMVGRAFAASTVAIAAQGGPPIPFQIAELNAYTERLVEQLCLSPNVRATWQLIQKTAQGTFRQVTIPYINAAMAELDAVDTISEKYETWNRLKSGLVSELMANPIELFLLYHYSCQAALQQSSLSADEHAHVMRVVDQPTDLTALSKFLDTFAIIHRNKVFARNIVSLLPSLPDDLPIVIIMGRSHAHEVASLLRTR